MPDPVAEKSRDVEKEIRQRRQVREETGKQVARLSVAMLAANEDISDIIGRLTRLENKIAKMGRNGSRK